MTPMEFADRIEASENSWNWIVVALGVIIGSLLAYPAHAETTVPGACVDQRSVEQQKRDLCEAQADIAFGKCWAKIRRFEDTQSTPESAMRLLWRCGYQAGVWNRRDP